MTALYAAFVDRYGDRIAPQHRMVCERLVGGFDAYLAEEAAEGRIQGLVHGDYRLDNMLFGADGADPGVEPLAELIRDRPARASRWP